MKVKYMYGFLSRVCTLVSVFYETMPEKECDGVPVGQVSDMFQWLRNLVGKLDQDAEYTGGARDIIEAAVALEENDCVRSTMLATAREFGFTEIGK